MSESAKNISFGERLRELRIQKKLSQAELGKAIGVQPTHIGRYERGETKPSAKYLKLLADCLNVSTDYLYDGIEEDAAVADMKDRELLEMFTKAENLSEKDKETIKELLRAFIKNKEMEKLIAS